jgi:hypothetical protein
MDAMNTGNETNLERAAEARDASVVDGSIAGRPAGSSLMITPSPRALSAGFKLGTNGPHSSRTMMIEDLRVLLERTPQEASLADFRQIIVAENLLGKKTESTRRETLRRLRELYTLDVETLVFQVLRAYWPHDAAGRPLLALLIALARDPLLRISTSVIFNSRPGGEVPVRLFDEALSRAMPGHFGPKIQAATARHIASSWEQSGHLTGRSRKTRLAVRPTPWTVALALFLAYLAGERGEYLLSSQWLSVLDVRPGDAGEHVTAAHRLGLLNCFRSGSVVQITFPGWLKTTGE